MKKERTYICIDLKSFYASVECADMGLDPLTTRLVVADPERSEKTICLAISPAMKALGIHNRCRVFEIPKGIDYIMAQPRMQRYIDVSANIYGIYLKYIAKEDIHVYSIDECFMDVTDYLHMYHMTAKELAMRIMQEVYEKTMITATCGIGTNLYLAKVALDITAKHVEDYVGFLDEETYRNTLWNHKPLTDFWRVGRGIASRLATCGIYDMQGIAEADEDLMYQLFGIDAELLIDHAWGRETTTMPDIKNFKSKHNCLSSGQVLCHGYSFTDGKLIAKEMADLLCLELVAKNLVTESVSLYIGYENGYNKPHANGSIGLPTATCSAKLIMNYVEKLYDRIVDPFTPVRRLNLSFNNVVAGEYQQYDLFTDPAELEREKKMQLAMLDIKKKFGKNAIL